jgi:hypothetical protein
VWFNIAKVGLQYDERCTNWLFFKLPLLQLVVYEIVYSYLQYMNVTVIAKKAIINCVYSFFVHIFPVSLYTLQVEDCIPVTLLFLKDPYAIVSVIKQADGSGDSHTWLTFLPYHVTYRTPAGISVCVKNILHNGIFLPSPLAKCLAIIYKNCRQGPTSQYLQKGLPMLLMASLHPTVKFMITCQLLRPPVPYTFFFLNPFRFVETSLSPT